LPEDFIAGEHKWADFLDACFVTDRRTETKVYFKYHERRRLGVRWFLDGQRVLDPAIFTPYLRQRNELVKYRNFRLDHVWNVLHGGIQYYLERPNYDDN